MSSQRSVLEYNEPVQEKQNIAMMMLFNVTNVGYFVFTRIFIVRQIQFQHD